MLIHSHIWRFRTVASELYVNAFRFGTSFERMRSIYEWVKLFLDPIRVVSLISFLFMCVCVCMCKFNATTRRLASKAQWIPFYVWVESLFSFFACWTFYFRTWKRLFIWDNVVPFNAKRNENLRHDCVEVGRLHDNI